MLINCWLDVDPSRPTPGRCRHRWLAYLKDSATLPKYKHDTQRGWINLGWKPPMLQLFFLLGHDLNAAISDGNLTVPIGTIPRPKNLDIWS
jgi:hypothetical protein